MKKRLLFLCMLTLLLTGCQQIKETINLVNCKYKVHNASDVTWAGINLSHIHSVNDLSIADLAKATNAILNNDFNLGFNLNVLAVNPTASPASINGFDYILLLDENQLTSGQNASRNIRVEPNGGQEVIPITMNVNVGDFLTNGNIENMINLARNIVNYGDGRESAIKVRFSPWLPLGNSVFKAPYITLNHTLQ